MDDVLYDGTGLPPAEADTAEQEQTPGPASTSEVPDGSQEVQLDWIRAGETPEVRRQRADAVWAKAQHSGISEEEGAQLSGYLTGAVYTEHQEPTGSPEDQQPPQSDGDGPPYEGGAEQSGPDAGPGPETPDAVAVPGELVESDTAGTGGAVNGETGEATAPGEPLPPVDSLTGAGTPLDTPGPVDPEQSGQQPT